jgi:glycosyltransferase involved in cell wall biosynthesis
MSAAPVIEELSLGAFASPLAVSAVCNPGSLGIARYVSRLEEALVRVGVDYRPVRRGRGGGAAHYHLGNSSRALLVERPGRHVPFVVTVHDVVPRTRALAPLYRARVYPQLLEDARAVVVHSVFAADLLETVARGRPRRLVVIPHPAPRPQAGTRVEARRTLGWPEDELLVVLPGVIKAAKLVREAVEAVASAPGWRLALVGRLADPGAARAARRRGALILPEPDDAAYERAMVAADSVLCLRSGSVGETNGPLLDALGAGRAVLATRSGSIPEVAGEGASYCNGTAAGIREGLIMLSDDRVRSVLERRADRRARELSWEASATRHAELFREVLGG